MKKLIYAVSALMLFASCSKEEGGGGSGDVNEKTDVTKVTSVLSVEMSTDKAFYKPGELVTFTIKTKPTATTYVRYRNLTDVIKEEPLTDKTWTWTPPSADFTGYMVDLYQKTDDMTENVVGTIAVDVSSDWTRFPRYGFVAAFGNDKTDAVIEAEMEGLCRYHINGVQFQDWHWKHHWPMGGTRDNPLASYTDIANRVNYASVIKKYISTQHKYGMYSMFYNLCYGALDEDGAAEDGVKSSWYAYKNTDHTGKDCHELLNIGWKSNIYLLDASNAEWQAYMAQRNDDVYHNFDFDGYQIDQLGGRGTLYNYNGGIINMTKSYASFIKAMKAAHPDKKLVMNAVSNYGAEDIASTGDVDFCYNELWAGESNFSDMRSAIIANDNYSGKTLKTVFAAYMNYDYSKNNSGSNFNNAGVILTDAVIFALGGSHLELGGDHMLGNEYFPNTNLKMSSSLKTAMIRYYDFMTAYENILRGDGTENAPTIKCTTAQKLSAWTSQKGPQTGYVVTYSKQVGNRQIVNLLNFVKANSTSWRDLNGDMPVPSTISNMGLQVSYSNKISKVWVASPDQNGGVPQEVTFRQQDGVVTIVVPSLKYWTMLVIE